MATEYISGSLDEIKYVFMIVKYKDKFVLSWHKKSQKWDNVGGHVEKDEKPLAAAKRELYEETGAVDFDIVPVCDFKAYRDDGVFHNNGRTYFVNVRKFTELPDGSEMGKIGFFDEIPENFRYVGEHEKYTANYKRFEKYALAYFE